MSASTSVRAFASPPAEEPEPGWIRAHGSPLLVLDCERVRAQYRSLARALPGVELHYAVKALPHPAVLAALDEEQSSFDVSTSGEIELLRARSVAPERVIYTHPVKRGRDIRDALDFGCRTFVVDNAAEMEKFVPHRDCASLLLRVAFRGVDAVVDLARKFGCHPESAFDLLAHGTRRGLRIEGVSFHVGSQCLSPGGHIGAILRSRELFERARTAGVATLRILDIGGGFPIPYDTEVPSIEAFCAPIQLALATLPSDVRVVAEPGRFLVGPAMKCITSVVGKARRGERLWYYLDEGVYGSFSGQVYDRARYALSIISRSTSKPAPSVLAGPTCDGADVIAEDIWLPELEIGDLVVASSMGAYTLASAGEFNSIPRTKVLVLGAPGRSGAS